MIKHMTTLTMCPTTHVPHPPRCPISIFHINHDTPLPMCPIAHVFCCPYVICQKNVKLSKRCQAVKKMSRCQKDVKCQKVKHMDYGGGSQKKIN